MPSSRKPNASKAKKSQRFHGRYERPGRLCDAPGCDEDGEFRAPPAGLASGMSRYDGPGEWRWFCLDHIRDFNAGYNFFEGMSADEIYDAQKPMSGWESESRAYANHGDPTPRWASFSDPLDAIGARFRENLRERSQAGMAASRLGKADRQALSTLGLGEDASRRTIRKAYSEQVRRYHPDRNGGDRTHEKKLQAVVEAWNILKNSENFS